MMEKNAWDTPLLADNQKDQDNNQDGTTMTTETTNNQGILNLTDGESISNRLSFMKEEFQKSINMANKERELSLSELRSFIKNTKEEYDSIFINQDKVIKALQKGQQQTNETIQGLQQEFSLLNKSLQQLLFPSNAKYSFTLQASPLFVTPNANNNNAICIYIIWV